MSEQKLKYADVEWDGVQDWSEWYENKGIDVTVPSLTIMSEPSYRFSGMDATECLSSVPAETSQTETTGSNNTTSLEGLGIESESNSTQGSTGQPNVATETSGGGIGDTPTGVGSRASRRHDPSMSAFP
jgi:hypothetical protein